MPGSEDKLAALLKDLQELGTYLHGRGDRSLQLSQKFAENAEKDPGNREFDLNQARMLDYQHNLFHEIANMVDKLVKQHDR